MNFKWILITQNYHAFTLLPFQGVVKGYSYPTSLFCFLRMVSVNGVFRYFCLAFNAIGAVTVRLVRATLT